MFFLVPQTATQTATATVPVPYWKAATPRGFEAMGLKQGPILGTPLTQLFRHVFFCSGLKKSMLLTIFGCTTVIWIIRLV